MNLKIFFVLTLVIILISCKSNGVEYQQIDQDKNGFYLPVGQKRIVYSTYSGKGKVTDFLIPKIGIFEILKDTTVNGYAGKIISSVQIEYDKDSAHTFKERDLLLQEGSQTNLYQFREGNTAFLFGLFKTGTYDTTIFSDKMTVLEFPLAIGNKWNIRDSSEANGAWVISKEFVKLDTLDYDGTKYICDVFTLHSVVDLTSWVSSIGLLKAEIDYGISRVTDSDDVFIDSVSNFETYELLKLNPTDSEIDSIKTKYSKNLRKVGIFN